MPKYARLESEEWLRLATTGSPMGLWAWDEEKVYGYWDAKSYELFGVSSDVENTLDMFYNSVHPDDCSRLEKQWRHQRENRLPTDLEYRVLRPDGSIRWLHSIGNGYYGRSGKVRVVGVNFDITERKRAEQERLELSSGLINAQERERARIARELHDDFSQRIAILSLEIDSLVRTPKDLAEISKQLTDLRKKVSEIGTDLHALSHQLHSVKLELLGLAATVKSFCEEFARRQGIRVDFSHKNLPTSIPPETALGLYRIVQEGLRNVAKHSHASNAQVRLTANSEAVFLTVSDNGIGFEPSAVLLAEGIGVRSMRERARMLHGTFEVLSRPMQGTQIAVRVPLQ
jgi:PAS domain S-box-containing protein